MGDKNVVKVEVIVDEDGRAKAGFDDLTRSATQFTAEVESKGAAAFQRLRDEHGKFVSATAAGAQTLSASAKAYEQDLLKAGVAAERAREEALKFQETSQSAADTAARAYTYTEKEIERLRGSLRATREEALALQNELAKQGNAPASRAAADLARRAERGAVSLDAAAAGKDQLGVERVDAFSRGGAQRTLSTLKEEAKGFNEEVQKSGNLLSDLNRRIPGLGSPIGSVVRGLFGGLLIVEAVRGVVSLVDEYRALKRADEEARQQLIQTSVDTGANIQREVEQVNALKASYHGLSQAILDSLEAEARRAVHAPVTQQSVEEATRKLNPTTENDVTRALQSLPDDVLARAALDAATKRGLLDKGRLDKGGLFSDVHGEARAEAARKGLADLVAGNPQSLTGLSDAEAQARFASVIGKLPSDFTDEEKRLARINALLQESSGAYTTAADAVTTYTGALEALHALHKAQAAKTQGPATQAQSGQSLDLTNPLALAAQAVGLLQSARGAQDASLQAADAGYRQALAAANAAAEQNSRDELERQERIKKGIEGEKKTSEEFWKDVEKNDAEEARRAEERKRAYEQVRAAVASARDAAREFLSGALVKGDKDNPFTSLFIRLNTEVEDTRKRFLTFGSDFADMMAKVKQAEIEQEIAVARLQSRLSQLHAQQEARRLELPLIGLSGPEERALAVFSARIGAATSGVQGAITGEALRAGLTRIDPAYLAQRQYDQLQKLEKDVGGLAGGRDALDAAYKSLFASLPDEIKQAVAKNPALRDTFAGAFGRDAERARKEIKDSIARERAGDLVQSDARELLSAVTNARGVGRDEQLKQFLAVTGTLSEKELTPDLRVARAQFLQESAKRDSQKEQQGEARANRLDAVMAKLNSLISQKGIKVDSAPIGINLNVGDGLDVDKSLTGESPTAEKGGDWY